MPNRVPVTPPVSPPMPPVTNVTNNGVENWMLTAFQGLIKLNTLKAIVLMLVGTCCAVLFYHADKILDITQANLMRTAKLHETALTDAVINDRQISAVLGNLLVKDGSSRVLMWQFHNGTETLRGIPFLFASATGERTAVGISSARPQMDRIDIRTVISFLPSFLKADCVDRKLEDADPAMRDAMLSVGTLRIMACPVFISGSREPAGYVAETYTQGFTQPDPQIAFEHLKDASTILGATLGAYLNGKK